MRLHHPNIVQIYEVSTADGIPYLALEYVAGGSLELHLHGQPLPPRQGAELVATLAGAVHHAHQHGIVHRDLKPANILLSVVGSPSSVATLAEPRTTDHGPRTIPKIADFGLAKKLDEVGQTQTGAVLGTPSYMAPEQAAGRTKDVGPATDVYALGAILYEVLTGRPPFTATLWWRRWSKFGPRSRRLAPSGTESAAAAGNHLSEMSAQGIGTPLSLGSGMAVDLDSYLKGESIAAPGESVVGVERFWTAANPWANCGAGPDLFLVCASLAFGGDPAVVSVRPHGSVLSPGVVVVISGACLLMMTAAYYFQTRRTIVQTAQLNRQFWSIRIGTLLAMATSTALSYLSTPPGETWNALAVFPMWSVFCGLLFSRWQG